MFFSWSIFLILSIYLVFPHQNTSLSYMDTCVSEGIVLDEGRNDCVEFWRKPQALSPVMEMV